MAKGWGWKLADLMLNLYGKGLLGGQPKEMLNLYEEALRGKVTTAKTGDALAQKPIWTAGPTPAPGEGIAAGGIIPPDYKEGPTYGEAEALDLPGILKSMIGRKASMPFMAGPGEKLFGPEVWKGMGEQPWTSPEGIKWQDFLQSRLLGAAQKLEQPKDMEIREEEVKKPTEEWLPESFVSYTPKVKDLTDALIKTAFGLTEKEKRPKLTMGKPGETPIVTTGPELGKRFPRIPPEKPGEKPRTGVLGQYDEWKKAHPGATFGDYKKAMKGISLMEAEPSIEDLSGEVRKWMTLEKTLAMGGLDNEILVAMMAMLPEGDPMKQAWQTQDLSALQEMATQNREYYQERLSEAQIKKAYPNARKDEQGNWTVTIGGKEYVITP